VATKNEPRGVSSSPVATRRRIRRDDVIDQAVALADEGGVDAVTLASIADRLGCRAPSLYTHVDGLDDVLEAAAIRATTEFADTLRDAVMGRSGEDGVRAFAAAWRQWVRVHPGRYALSLRRPVAEARPARRAAGEGATAAAAAVLRSLGVPDVQIADAGRALRATLHGFAQLEAEGSIGRDPDRTFAVVVDTAVAGLRACCVDAAASTANTSGAPRP
jgi:AcrR family transcriptional regulator